MKTRTVYSYFIQNNTSMLPEELKRTPMNTLQKIIFHSENTKTKNMASVQKYN